MNNNVDLQTFKALYSANKQYFVPIFMIMVSFFLIFFALIPQFQDLMTTLSQRGVAQQELQTLENNLNILNATDEADVDTKLATVFRALPPAKDFESVLTTISSVGASSGVPIGNFEFRVGDITGVASGSDAFPSLSLTLILSDGADGASRFMASLAESLPLSEVKKVDVNSNSTTLSIEFYYRSLSSAKISSDSKIVPISGKQSELLDKLMSWDSKINFDIISEVGTPSSSTTPF